jgi:hypothetical protein
MNNEPIGKWRWNEHMNRRIDEALSELEREAHVRMRCYDRWIQEGKVSRVDAWDRLERLVSAIKHLRDMETLLAKVASDKATESTEDRLNVITEERFQEQLAEVRQLSAD